MALAVDKLIPSNSVSAGAHDRQREFAQFFTPSSVSDLMASLFQTQWTEVRLLDAGAGAGALTAAVVRRICQCDVRPETVEVTAFEIDETLLPALESCLRECASLCSAVGIEFRSLIRNEDFVLSASREHELFGTSVGRFNAAIVNPPYRKIRSDSEDRAALSSAGIETTNLYSAFLALIVRLLEPGGELVAITPRSFCNGPYFRQFRHELLSLAALQRLHVFESRRAAFAADNVLQENVILHAIKGREQQSPVLISSSDGTPDGPVAQREVAFSEIVMPTDAEKFIHFPVNEALTKAQLAMGMLTTSLPEIGLSVSTGRVVDFRARDYLRRVPGEDTVPLIYPSHFDGLFVRWPRNDSRKPNAIVNTEQTQDLLLPSGMYVLTKRFTAKEERKRVVACIFDPSLITANLVGFENHLNYFHANGGGLAIELAFGLALFLNSTLVDQYLRRFSGHTQINATDLRNLHYPPQSALENLGRKCGATTLNQQQVDNMIECELALLASNQSRVYN